MSLPINDNQYKPIKSQVYSVVIKIENVVVIRYKITYLLLTAFSALLIALEAV